MSDNIAVTPGTGATIGADDVGGVLIQRVKPAWGVDGTATDVSAAAPLPVVQTGTPALPTGAATETTLATVVTSVDMVEAALTTITGHVDQVETKLDTLAGHVDGVESALATISGNVDGLETSLTTITGHVDAVETKLDSIITALAAATPAGTNNIGDVDVLTLPPVTANDLDIRFLQRDGDAVAVAHQTDRMMEGATALTPKFATVSASSSGNNQIVALVASKKIRVLAYVLVAAGTVAAKWRSASTDKTGAMPFVANTGVSVNFSPVGHFETAAGEALNLNLDAAVAVSGHVCYLEVS